MKRILILTLLVLILFSSCAAPIESHSPKNTDTSNNVTDEQVKSKDQGSTNIPSVTLEPSQTPIPTLAPTPVPTPYPDELVEEASGYGFTYEESNPLYIEPDTNGIVVAELEADSDLLITGEMNDFTSRANGAVSFLQKSVAFSIHKRSG